MASARDYAQQQLGNLDLSYLDNERNVARQTHQTSVNNLENTFNNLLQQLETNRADNRRNFNTGRNTVAENAWANNRANSTDVGSRVLGKTGLQNLGEVGNRIETGRQYSTLANDFYGAMDQLNTTEQQSRTQRDIDLEVLMNTLNQTLAGIDTRGAEAGNSWNQALAQLAEQVQGRWDNNANASAALAAQRQIASQQQQAALQSARQQALYGIVEGVNNGSLSTDRAIANLQTQFGLNSADARALLQSFGLEPIKSFSYSYGENYQPNNSLYNSIINGTYGR